MPSLFDTLGSPQSVQPMAAPTEASEQIQKITDVGTTGKAPAGAPAPKRSALGEAGALDEVKSGLQQLDEQQTQIMVGQQFASHELDVEEMIQNKQLDQGVMDMRTKAIAESTKIYGELSRSKDALNSERSMAQVEQLGVTTRLATDRYVFNLQTEGMKNRLNNQFAFDEALQAAILRGNYDIAKHDSDAAIDLNADKNEWLLQIGKIDIEAALRYSGMSDAEFRTAAVAKGVAGVTEAAASYYGKQSPTGTTTASPDNPIATSQYDEGSTDVQPAPAGG